MFSEQLKHYVLIWELQPPLTYATTKKKKSNGKLSRLTMSRQLFYWALWWPLALPSWAQYSPFTVSQFQTPELIISQSELIWGTFLFYSNECAPKYRQIYIHMHSDLRKKSVFWNVPFCVSSKRECIKFKFCKYALVQLFNNVAVKSKSSVFWNEDSLDVKREKWGIK